LSQLSPKSFTACNNYIHNIIGSKESLPPPSIFLSDS
jgi:hypothetical protein